MYLHEDKDIFSEVIIATIPAEQVEKDYFVSYLLVQINAKTEQVRCNK